MTLNYIMAYKKDLLSYRIYEQLYRSELKDIFRPIDRSLDRCRFATNYSDIYMYNDNYPTSITDSFDEIRREIRIKSYKFSNIYN